MITDIRNFQQLEHDLLRRANSEGVTPIQQGEVATAIRLQLAGLISIDTVVSIGGAPTIRPTEQGRAFGGRVAA